MTAQDPEKLVNDSDVDLTWLKPFFVSKSSYPVQPKLPENPRFCTANWNGYIAILRLHADYRLELEQFEFPYFDDMAPQVCNAFFSGDFSITFRPFFGGPRTKIPFRDGRIVQDREEWEIDGQTVDAWVDRVLRRSGSDKPYGLRVTVSDFSCFAPRSIVPTQWREDLDSLVGKSVKASILLIDEERGTVVLEIEDVLGE
ncbi:MAG: hypothetical protein AAF394_02325 [Planctomycetota bacterium]